MLLPFLRKAFFLLCFLATASQIQTITDYKKQLPIWGTSWDPGGDSTSTYYPSFYTGFAPRSEYADRIHIRTARGNQTRVSVILDEQTIKDYLFDLVYRDAFYKEVSAGTKPTVNVTPKGRVLPQQTFFSDIVNSSTYNIQALVAAKNAGTISSEEFYQKSLDIISQLNPGRVFMINLDLNKEFARWQTLIQKILNGRAPESVLTAESTETVAAINSLVWGRVNMTDAPSNSVIQKLQIAATAALNGNQQQLQSAALALFVEVTGQKYQIQVVAENGQWVAAINCNASECSLRYPEFTAIYPTGSAQSFTSDDYGNKIPNFATPGLWSFLERSYHEVDHIRKEPYYGWAPKMDFEDIGNGFHNPAVRFNGANFSKDTKEALGAPKDHTQLWAVKRGGVSHGCLRLSLGHVWEMRHIMPVENDKMKQVYFFGNNSSDFDVYDINGDGELEVMGLEYQITYDTKGSSGLDRREGEELMLTAENREAYYLGLYGKKNVFSKMGDSFVFQNPQVSFPSQLDYQKKNTKTSLTLEGQYPLYEQAYEQDKVQFYSSPRGIDKQLVRLMGRVRGCSPDSDKNDCGQAAFEQEKSKVLN